jgi:putative tricarboxylic transport membrane protein
MFVDAFAGAFLILLDPVVWVFVALGAAWGIFVGAMPGIGTTLGYALLIPLSFTLPPVTSVAMLLSVAVGSQFGNSIPAILVGVPGGSSTVMTVLEGYTLFKQGKSDIALGASYIGALVGQVLSIPLFVALVIPLANLAYVFQAPELFAMYTLGIVAIVSIASGNMVKGLVSAGLGLLVGLIGLDPLSGRVRFTFDIVSLRPGLDDAAVIVGLLAGGELLRSARQAFQWPVESGGLTSRIRLPKLSRMGGRDMVAPVVGGTIIGTLVGAIPGAGARRGKVPLDRSEDGARAGLADIGRAHISRTLTNVPFLNRCRSRALLWAECIIDSRSQSRLSGGVEWPFLAA